MSKYGVGSTHFMQLLYELEIEVDKNGRSRGQFEILALFNDL